MNNTTPVNFRFQQGFSYLVMMLLFVTPILRFSWDIGPKTFINIFTLALALIIINTYKLSFNKLRLAAGMLFVAIVGVSSVLNSSASFFTSDAFIIADSVFLAYLSSSIAKDDKRTLLIIPVLVGSVLSIIMLIKLMLAYSNIDNDFSSIGVVFVNYNVIAGYLLMVLPLTLILWENSTALGVSVSLVILCGLFATGCRTAIVISCISAGIILYARRNKGRGQWMPVLSVLALFAAASFAIMSKPGFSESFFNRLSWINTSTAMFVKNPFMGVGWGNFGSYYLAYKTGPGLNSLYAHNLLFQLLAESGLFGLVSFIWLIYSFFRQMIINRGGEGPNLYLPASLSVFSFLFYNLFDSGFYIPALKVLFFIILGQPVSS